MIAHDELAASRRVQPACRGPAGAMSSRFMRQLKDAMHLEGGFPIRSWILAGQCSQLFTPPRSTCRCGRPTNAADAASAAQEDAYAGSPSTSSSTCDQCARSSSSRRRMLLASRRPAAQSHVSSPTASSSCRMVASSQSGNRACNDGVYVCPYQTSRKSYAGLLRLSISDSASH